MDQHIQIRIHDIGISIVNDIPYDDTCDDIAREEILYISLNKSKVIWTEVKRNRVKLLSPDLNKALEKLYQDHIIQCEINPDDKELLLKRYDIDGFRVKFFMPFFVSNFIPFFFQRDFHLTVIQQH